LQRQRQKLREMKALNLAQEASLLQGMRATEKDVFY